MCCTNGIRSLAFFVSCFLWLLTSPYSTNVSANPVVFAVNTSSSQLTASGLLFGGPITNQGPGSLTTFFSGTINANLTGTNIQFTGGSLIAAQTNGIWQPAVGGVPGSAPADFGATNIGNFGEGGGETAPGNFALRNLLFDLTSPPLTMTNGNFDGGSLTFLIVTNTARVDWYYSLAGTYTNGGSTNLNGFATNGIGSAAILSTNGGLRQVVLQVNATYLETLVFVHDTYITFTGQLVATDALPAPPIIQSILRARPNVLITTKNTTAQSVLMISTNLTTWTVASATISTNGLGMIVFTTPSPISPGQAFYRIQQ